MRFQCIHCKGLVDVEDSDAGQAVQCCYCEKVVVVPASRLAPGAVINNDFVIEKELGKGGVGTVFLARQVSLDRAVALKILHARFAEDQEFISDFIREARAAAQLNHPNIVQAYAVGEDAGLYFFAMEYVEGTTLKQVLANAGRMVVDRALGIIKEVNSALAFAWTNQKLVHRDIKPDNIILTESGRIKVADLGLARKAQDLLEEHAEEVMGTPQYISPEQLMLQPVDCRGDIYSLGATLYHTVTGRFPYLGDNGNEIAQKHLTEPLTSPSAVVSDLSPAVSTLIEIMMAKRPEHRYTDGTELARDIELVLKGGFPQHPLSPDSQLPLMSGDAGGSTSHAAAARTGSAGRLAAGAGGKRLMVRSKGTPRAAGTSTGPLPVVTPTATSTTAAPAAEAFTASGESGMAAAPVLPAAVAAPRRRKKVPLGVWFALLGVALVIGVGGGVTLLVMQRIDMKRTPLERELIRLRKLYPKEHVQEYVVMLQLINEQRPTAEVLVAAKQYDDKYQDKGDHEISTLIHGLTDRYQEEQLMELRKAKYDEELKQWKDHSLKLKQEQQKQLEEMANIERQKKLELEAAARAEAEKKRREALIDELKQEQEKLRWAAVEFGRVGKFGDAKALFVAMAGSKEQEFAEWARNKQRSFDMAEKTAGMILNSKEALKGIKIDLLDRNGRRKKWTVASIGARDVNLECRAINVKTGNFEEEKLSVVFDDLPPSTRAELLDKGWEKAGAAGAGLDKNLHIGCYLMAKGYVESLNDCQQRLSSVKPEDGGPFVEEIKVLDPLIRAKQFEQDMDKLRLAVNGGDLPTIKTLSLQLKVRFPDKAGEVDALVGSGK